MDTLDVTTSFIWSNAVIRAQVLEDGSVKIWWYYPEIKQDRHEVTLTTQEWNRFSAWVQWKRAGG